MKKQILLLSLAVILLLSACSQSKEEKIRAYIEDYSFYDTLIDFTEGELNIEVQMFEPEDNDIAQLDVVVETKTLLESIKKYSNEHSDTIKEVNLYFIPKETNEIVAEINANSNTVSATTWGELDRYELPQIVDGYKFYGVSN